MALFGEDDSVPVSVLDYPPSLSPPTDPQVQVNIEIQCAPSDRCMTLEPLHSLSDFCYVVRNEVVAAIGAADTAYGQGPWERFTGNRQMAPAPGKN